MKFIDNLGLRIWRHAAALDPWTNAYGFARSLLALSTLLTFLFSHSTSLFCPASGRPSAINTKGPAAISLFALLQNTPELARWLCVIALAVVVSGWRPRWTGVLHWWIVFSFQVSATMVDGGDQITSVLALLLIPVTLTDDRKWHWERRIARDGFGEIGRRLVAMSALLLIRIQMAGLYFHAALGKTKPEEWIDGTALYYWFQDPSFGAPSWLMNAGLRAILLSSGVALLTWGIIAFEFALAAALVMNRRAWKPLMIAGIVFHLGIAVVHGLISFSMAMKAGLLLYLTPRGAWFGFLEREKQESIERLESPSYSAAA